MPLQARIEDSVPMPERVERSSFEDTLKAAAKTAALLAEAGLEMIPDADDRDVAAAITSSYAADPQKTEKHVQPKQISTLTPAALLLTHQLLREFGTRVVEDSVQIRNLVTNKLIQETENADPRIRIRALELLGKFSDVGLFTERTEVTVTHQTSDDIRAKLREKLSSLIDITPTEPENE